MAPDTLAQPLPAWTAHGSKLGCKIVCKAQQDEDPERQHHGMQRCCKMEDFRGKRQDDDHADDQPALNAPMPASRPDRGSPGCKRPQG